MKKVLRLSPTGPELKSEQGGLAVPGDGMRVRMDERKATIAGYIINEPQELGGGNLRASLDAPNPNLRYKAQVQLNTFYQTETPGTLIADLRVQVQRSIDGGDTWANVASDTFTTRGSSEARMAVANVEASLGSELWDIPSPPPARLEIRALLSTSTASTAIQIDSQEGFISLSEVL